MSTPTTASRLHRGLMTRGPVDVDARTRTVAMTGTRRGVLRLLAGLPLAGALAALLGEASEAGRQHRRSAQHRHQTGNNKEHRTGQRQGKKTRRCAQAGQTRKKRTRPKCCAGLSPDASGRCAAAATSVSPSPQPSPGCTGLKPTDDLQAAIDAAAEDATLTLCAGTWKLTETIVIAKNLTLRGVGAGATTLDGGDAIRVLRIDAGAEVTLQDLAITKGRAGGDNYPDDTGGGIYNDAGTVSLIGVSVSGSTATYGGGISNGNGTLTLEGNSRVTGNTAFNGGGIYTDLGSVILQAGSRVSENAASAGGGILTAGGMVTLQADSRVTDNTATARGGGIYNGYGTVTLQTGSSVSGNTATDYGGGIILEGGTLTLQANSSVTDNSAGEVGGGILSFLGGSVTLEAGSRVTGNSAGEIGGGISMSAGGVATVDASALICNNTPSDSQCINVPNCPNPPGGICPG